MEQTLRNKRRKKILYVLNTYLPDTDFFFLEIIWNDNDQIERNVKKNKINSPDFKEKQDEEEIIKEFRERIHQYELVYEEVGVSSSVPEKDQK